MNYGIRIYITQSHILNAGYLPQISHSYSRIQLKQFVSSYRLPRFHIIQVKKGEWYVHWDYKKNGEHRTKTNLCEETRAELKKLNVLWKT